MRKIILFFITMLMVINIQANNRSSIIYSGKSNDNSIALTFDDGPDPVNTIKVLDTLKKYDIKATFFLVGQNVKRYPNIVKRIYDEGHTIGNHSYTHGRFYKGDKEIISKEIIQTQNVIEEVIGLKPVFFRPPYGAVSKNLIDVCKENNLEVVNWNVDTEDWKKTIKASDLINQIKNINKSNRIILMHTMAHLNKTSEALEPIIISLVQRGFKLKTLNEILEIEPYQSN